MSTSSIVIPGVCFMLLNACMYFLEECSTLGKFINQMLQVYLETTCICVCEIVAMCV